MKKTFELSVLALSVASFALASCAHESPKTSSDVATRPTLVLIQGVHLDGASWDAVKKGIDPAQYTLMDLGRVGRDVDHPASVQEIATLSCQGIPSGAILVAHSFAGAVANEMVGICPDKIARIIYVAAVLPMKGEKPFERMSKTDHSNYLKAVDFKSSLVVPKSPKKFFAVTDASVNPKGPFPKLYGEAVSLTTEPVEFDSTRYYAIPKAYITTDQDLVLSPATQKNYMAHAGIKNTDGVSTGHFPMISAPAALATLIVKWAGKSKDEM